MRASCSVMGSTSPSARTVPPRPAGIALDFGEFTNCGALQPPSAPTGLTTATGSSQTIALDWTEPASCNMATNFVLEAGSASGLSDLGTARTGSTATDYVISNVDPGTYYLRVKGENAAGMSAASNEVALTMGVPGGATLVAPVGTAATGTLAYQWTAVAGASSYYLWMTTAARHHDSRSGSRPPPLAAAVEPACVRSRLDCRSLGAPHVGGFARGTRPGSEPGAHQGTSRCRLSALQP